MTAALGAWLPPVLWAALIFAASSGDLRAPGPSIPHIDKVAHFIEYGVLGLLLCRALLSGRRARSPVAAAALATALGLLYGASDEFHQSRVPGRTPDVADLAADLAGAAAGSALWAARRRRPAAEPG